MIKPIKKFKEFINESFNSGKLRSIIKQNGYPKKSWDKKLLHDIQDSDVIGICNSKEEYDEKYKNDGKSYGFTKEYGNYKRNKTFFIELENGKLLVLKNYDILKDEVDSLNKETLEDRIEKIRQERRKYHVGIEKEDKLAMKHTGYIVDEQERRKFLREFFTEENTKEFSDFVESEIEGRYIDDVQEDVTVNCEQELEIEIAGKKIEITVEYEVYCGEPYRSYGKEFADISCKINEINIYFEDDEIEAEAIRDNIYKGKTRFKEKHVSIGIYDYYKAYGVDPRWFYSD